MVPNLLRKPENARFMTEEEYRANVAAVDINLEAMDLMLIVESRSMPPSALFNNLGGSMGFHLLPTSSVPIQTNTFSYL